MPHPKLYVVTRSDLSPGQQATQSAHAAFSFATECPDVTKRWFEDSTYLVLLAAADEEALTKILVAARSAGLQVSVWREPDMAWELTAIAVEPEPRAERLLANLPLTLREPAMC